LEAIGGVVDMEAWLIATSILIGYIVLCIILGIGSWRILKVDLEDYFVLSRTAGFALLYLGIVATYHSAFAILTSAAVFRSFGIAFWAAGTWTFMTGICTYLLGYRFWLLGKKYSYITPGDLLSDYYESNLLRIIIAVVYAIFMVPYITVQAIGLGIITSIASFGNIPYEVGVIALLGVTALYLTLGGVRAIYWTDLMQGIWMFVGIWAGGLFLVFSLFGGPAGMFEAVAKVKPELLSLPGVARYAPYPMWFSWLLLFAVGIVLQPQIWMNYYTARDAKTMKWLGATTPLYLMFIYVPAAFIGLSAAALEAQGRFPELASMIKTFGTADVVFPAMMMKYAPAWFTGLVMAGAAAAAMSTADRMFNSTTAVLVRDLYQRYIKPQASQKHLVNASRFLVLPLYLLGCWFALMKPGILFEIVLIAGAGTLQLLPAVIGAIYPMRFKLTKAGVISGIVVGAFMQFPLLLFPRWGWLPKEWLNPYDFHAGVWGLVFNIIIAIIVSLFTRKPSTQATEKFHGYLEAEIYGRK